jgi:flagellar hook protein FlgE
MSFQQGLSGLNAAAKNLDVIGNNVANSNTTGFKGSVANFGDVFSAALGGGDGAQIGIGTTLSSVAQQFSQGNITVTNNPLDIAINGKGFFRTSDNGTISYTRNGQFAIDKSGNIVDSSGSNLTGFQALNGKIVPGVLVNLTLSTSDLPPTPTINVTVGANLSSADKLPSVATFDPINPLSFNFSTATTVIDSLGQSHTETLYFNKDTVLQNTWKVRSYVDGVAVDTVDPASGATPPATMPTTLTFDTAGGFVSALDIDTAATPVSHIPVAKVFTPTNGAAALSLNMDFTQMTQFGSGFGVNALNQDGFAAGQLSGYSISADGTILGRYNNGQTQTLGQVALANFSNSQGLKPQGESKWGETTSSGSPLIGGPGSASLGSLQSAAREDSNIDLTAELVNMITAQRIYQANAQTIKTQDAVLQTLVNLR